MPMLQEYPSRKNAKPPTVASQQYNETVLVVDDDATVLEITSMMLNRLAYETVGTESGKEALALFKSMRHSFAFVIVDFDLPDMDGQELCGAIKEIEGSAKVVLASGEDIASVKATDGALDFDGFLQKPFSLGQLKETIEQFDSLPEEK